MVSMQPALLPAAAAILRKQNDQTLSTDPCPPALQFRPPPMKHAGPKPKERYDDD